MLDLRKTPEFPRPKPTIGRATAEKQLLAHLSEAMKLISAGGVKTRDGMMEAIEAVICFLQDRGVSGQQIWPFELLRRELDFIFEGKRSRILQPGVKSRDDISGTRYVGPDKQDIRVFAAACSEALYQLGHLGTENFPRRKRTETDQFVARRMAKWRSFDHGQQTARTVKGWRDKLVKKKDAKFELLVRQYTRDEVGRQHLKEVLKVGPPHIGGF
ncbi:hypothetical protein ABMA32_24185 [Mesorhizobium sp. VNQ89]|uniref:hypothetical protein n=1 Tax=Mesorhizobium quangtriensis TaxID=3157709 RepID=UPI0032B729ED